MSRASKRNHSWRDRQTYIRQRRQADAMAERLGGGTDCLYIIGNIVCPICSFTMECPKRLDFNDLKSPYVSYHPAHPTCPNSNRAWLVPRVYCQPVPQSKVEAILEAEKQRWAQTMKELAAGVAGAAGSSTNTTGPFTP
jgi:hypothetical protein